MEELDEGIGLVAEPHVLLAVVAVHVATVHGASLLPPRDPGD
jgi:hypothetical protein